MENELELILKKSGLLRTFTSDWTQKWVPAILSYARKVKRKDVLKVIQDYDKIKEPESKLMCIC